MRFVPRVCAKVFYTTRRGNALAGDCATVGYGLRGCGNNNINMIMRVIRTYEFIYFYFLSRCVFARAKDPNEPQGRRTKSVRKYNIYIFICICIIY